MGSRGTHTLQALAGVLILALGVAVIVHNTSLLAVAEGRDVIVAWINIVVGVVAMVLALRLLVWAAKRETELRLTPQGSRHLLLLAMLVVGVVVFVISWTQPTPQVTLGVALAAIAIALTSLVVGEDGRRPEDHLQGIPRSPGA